MPNVGKLAATLSLDAKDFLAKMSESGRATDKFVTRTSTASTGLNRFTGSSKRGTAALLELSRGAEDAASQWGTQGLAGAIRGASNNLSQAAALMGGTYGIAVSLAAAGTSVLVSQLTKKKKAAKDAKKELSGLSDVMDRIARQGRLGDIAVGRLSESSKTRFLLQDLNRGKVSPDAAREMAQFDIPRQQAGLREQLAQLQGNRSGIVSQFSSLISDEQLRKFGTRIWKSSGFTASLDKPLRLGENFEETLAKQTIGKFTEPGQFKRFFDDDTLKRFRDAVRSVDEKSLKLTNTLKALDDRAKQVTMTLRKTSDPFGAKTGAGNPSAFGLGSPGKEFNTTDPLKRRLDDIDKARRSALDDLGGGPTDPDAFNSIQEKFGRIRAGVVRGARLSFLQRQSSLLSARSSLEGGIGGAGGSLSSTQDRVAIARRSAASLRQAGDPVQQEQLQVLKEMYKLQQEEVNAIKNNLVKLGIIKL